MSLLLGTASARIDINVDTALASLRKLETAFGNFKTADAAFDKVDSSAADMGKSLGTVSSKAESASKSVKTIESASMSAASGLNKGGAAADSFGNKFKKVEGDVQRVGVGLAAFGATITAAMGFAVSAAVQFEAAMQNVNSIARLASEDLSSISDSVIELGAAVGKGPTELAKGLYDIQSSGFEAAEGLEILETAAIAAGAGMTDTATASRAITSVLNAYGKSAEEAGNVSDVLFSIVDKGVLTFEGLANNLGQVLPLAAALKVPVEQLAAAYAQLTLNGVSAAQSETMIAAVMRSAINPTTELTAAVEAYGYSSAEALIKAEGLIGYLNLLITASGGSSAALSTLVGTGEAATAVLGLMSNNGADLTAMMGEMSGSMQDGAYTAGVFAIQADSTQFALQRFSAQLEIAKIRAGEVLSPLVRLGAELGSNLLSGFANLPAPIGATVVAMSGLVGASALAAGGVLLLLPKVLELRVAMQSFPKVANVFSKAITGLRFAFSPLGIAIAGLLVVGYALFQSWQEQQAAAESYEVALGNLGDTIELLRRRGDIGLAEQAEEFDFYIGKIEDATLKIEEFNALPLGPNVSEDTLVAAENLQKEIEALEQLQDTAGLTTQVVDKMNEALGDPDIDADAYIKWANDLIYATSLTETAIDDVEALQTILNTPLSDFSTSIDNDVIAPLADMTAAIEEVSTITEGWRTQMMDLQFEGLHQASLDVRDLAAIFEGSLDPVTKFAGSLTDATGELQLLYETQELTAAGLEKATFAYDKLNEAIASGEFDNEEILKQMERIATDPKYSPDERAQQYYQLALQIELTGTYALSATERILALKDSFDTSAGSAALFAAQLERVKAELAMQGKAAADMEVRATAYAESVHAANQANMEWLANGDNILGFLIAFTTNTESATTSLQGATGPLGAFVNGLNGLTGASGGAATGIANVNRGLLVANDLNIAADALDRVLYYYQQIDAIGQRSAGAESIATNLIGAPGEWALIDDMLQAGTLSLEQYNATLAAGTVIQESNARVQSDLNQMRADLLPLLAEEQLAYEQQVQALSELGPLEQRRALAYQDTAYQAKIATAYSTAYAISVGEIPEEVGTKMIVDAAQADPILKDLLLDLGLITETDGVISVSIPDGPSVQESIGDLTQAVEDLTRVTLGLPPLHLDVDGDAKDDIQSIRDELDGVSNKQWKAVVKIITENDDDGGPLAAIRRALGGKDTPDPVIVPLEWGDIPPPPELPDIPQKITLTYGLGPDEGAPPLPGAPSVPTSYPNMMDTQQHTAGAAAPITVPALDTSLYDASAAALEARVLATFQVTMPTSISTGLAVASTNIGMGTMVWNTGFAVSTQAILTLVNAVFVTAIPANVTLGMISASTAVSTNMALMGASYAVGAQSILTVTNAVFAVAIPANVQAGMTAAAAATAAGMSRMNSSISSGMSKATGTIRSGAGSWPGIIAGISLYGAGVSIMTSLGAGIIAGFASVRNTLLAITAEIPTLKGPPEKDARLLYDNGVLIMAGLERGMVDRFEGVKRTLSGMGDEIERAVSKSTSRSRVQRPGGGSTGDGGGGGTDTPPTGGTTEAKWSDAIAKGLTVATSDALKNSGLGTDTTVGSLFNEADWLARVKQRGAAMANDISDLFIGRTWLNSTDALINDGKFLEHYGSPVIPNEDITGRPPVVDPTRPPGGGVTVEPGFGYVRPRGQLPNRPNNGSNRDRVQQNVVNNYNTTTDARTTQQLASPELIRVMDGASRGRTAHSSLSSAGSKRTQAGGNRRSLGRV